MEAIMQISKVLGKNEYFYQQSDDHQLLQQYKKNVKLFIQEMQNEVCSIIEKYEKQIEILKLENQSLKKMKGQPKTFVRTSPLKQFQSISSYVDRPLSLMQTAKSNICTPFKHFKDEDLKFSQVLLKYKRSNDNQFPEQLINPEPQSDYLAGKSRFEAKNSKKKQIQQELIHCLETGKKNLDQNTNKFLSVIGRDKEEQIKEVPFQSKEHDGSNSSKSLKREVVMNQFLQNICTSLDSSYIAKKARNEKRKRVNYFEEEKRRKRQKQYDMGKGMKQRGLKSLLQRLRDNVSCSPNKPPAIVKISRLITCGQTHRQNSKVIINPVAIDISRKSHSSDRDRGSPTYSSQLKLPSILKQTSTILSHSLSGITAIHFGAD